MSQIIPILFNILLTLVISIISWFLIELYKRSIQNEKSLNDVKFNYLERFTQINSKLESIHIDIALIKNNIEKE